MKASENSGPQLAPFISKFKTAILLMPGTLELDRTVVMVVQFEKRKRKIKINE
jgi:hypothetical protein